LRSRWLLIAAIVAIGLVALAIFGRGPKTQYKATAVLVFDETGNPSRDQFIQDLTSAAALARTPLVATKTVARLNAVNSPEDLARKITVRANPAQNTVEITTVPYSSASKARALADGFAADLADSLSDHQDDLATRSGNAVGADQTSLADQLKTIEGKLAASAKAPADQQDMLRAQRDAIIRHLQDTIVGDLAVPNQQALTQIGSATAVRVDHSRLAPTTVPGWVLAEVPAVEGEGVVAATQPLSGAADAFRDLRTSLARLGRPPARHGAGRGMPLELTSTVVTSAGAGEGKTTTAVNLAAVVAETGKSVLVIDCDMRAPDAHGHLGVDPGPGLSDVLLGAATLDQVAVPTAVSG